MGDFKVGEICVCFLIEVGLAISSFIYLSNINDEFNMILSDLSDDTEIRTVSNDDYLGPVVIICDPNINSDCNTIFDEYSSITSTQSYFSLEFLDTSNDNSNIDAIISARHALYIFGIISISSLVFSSVVYDCGKAALDDDDDKENVLKKIITVLSGIVTIQLTIWKVLICITFSIGEISDGVLMLEYIPWHCMWVELIVVTVFMIVICCAVAFIFANKLEDGDNCIPIVCGCLTIVILLLQFVLYGLPSWGTYFYYMQFSNEFDVGSGQLLSPEYKSKTDELKSIAIALGIFPWIKMVLSCGEKLLKK